MGLSTFCRWALQSQNPAEHTKCSGTNCDCDCHRDTAVVRQKRRLVCPHPGCVRSFAHNEQRQLANHVSKAHDAHLTDYPPELLDPPELPDTNSTTTTPASPDPGHEGEPAVTSIAEHRAAEGAPDTPTNNGTAKQTRHWRSNEEKRAIIAALDVATTLEERHAILELHGIKPGSTVPSGWRKQLGLPPAPSLASNGAARKPRRPQREAPPEPATPAVTPDIDIVDEDEFEICITVSRTERDVLDALGFLDGHGDATGHLVHLVSDLCVAMADESDVKLVLTARRARASE